VAEFVGPFQHSLNRVPSCLVERDTPLARLVLAVTDVEHALSRRALDVPHFFEIDVPAPYVLYLDAAH
jgi:hypothetical protein